MLNVLLILLKIALSRSLRFKCCSKPQCNKRIRVIMHFYTEQNRTEPNGTERGRLIKKLSRLMLSCLILIVLHAVKTNLNAWYFESGTAHTHTSLYIQLNVWALVVVFHFIGDVMQYCHCACCDSKICLFNWNSISNVYVSVCPTCAMHFMHFEYDSNWYSWVYAEQFKWNPKHVLI